MHCLHPRHAGDIPTNQPTRKLKASEAMGREQETQQAGDGRCNTAKHLAQVETLNAAEQPLEKRMACFSPPFVVQAAGTIPTAKRKQRTQSGASLTQPVVQ